MKRWISISFDGASVLIALAIILIPVIARAESEGRTYLDLDGKVYECHVQPLELELRPFVRTESRFREKGLVYQQWFGGVRLKLLPWLSLQSFYSRQDLTYPDKPKAGQNLVVGDVVFHPRFGPFRLLNREENEWHITERFYRYRNMTEVLYTLPFQWLGLYAFDEFRIDSDQSRVNLNDVGGGFQFDPTRQLAIRLFYDRESNRRLKPQWEQTDFLGLSFAGHL